MFEVLALLCSMTSGECVPVESGDSSRFETVEACEAAINQGAYVFGIRVSSVEELNGGVVLFAGCVNREEIFPR